MIIFGENNMGKVQKNKIKGFTLVELLIVVAILGILAAVGIVSFGGFLGSAKDNASKANQKNAANFIAATVTKCSIDGGTINLTNTTLACSSVSGKDGSAVSTSFRNHFGASGENWKNPHNTANSAIGSSSSCATLGQTDITGASGTVTVCTKWGDGSSDKTSTIIALE